MTRLVFRLLACLVMAQPVVGHAGRFEAGKGTFKLDGRPFVVKAAELHYPRIPRQYWEQRIQMCKALGMNTICLYVFWNTHESEPGKFDFEGQNDLREFIELCDKNDMKVILRPGPYVCAEWEMGGLPWWLLKKKDIKLRENDPWFLDRVDKFQKKVAEQVKGLTIADGGPVIMVQVENEYGSYGIDKEYISNIRDMIRRNFGEDVTLFQCDWSSNFLNNGLDDLIWTMNFGTGANIDEQFKELREVRPDSPLMCSEYWSGWFDKWGDNHETRPAEDMIAGIDEMLSKGISFSLYMTHGGTNWGHWAGANSPGFAPDVTSYDYDAPISEAGRITPKYNLLRETMAKYNGGNPLPAIPDTIPSMTIFPFSFTEGAALFNNLPDPKRDGIIRPMEDYDQGFGTIVYSTTLPEVEEGSILYVKEPHDYARIFADGVLLGTLDRRKGEQKLTLPPLKDGTKLDILVEAMGRINFGRAIKDYKGITESVSILPPNAVQGTGRELFGWNVYNLHDTPDFYSSMELLPIDSLKRGDDGRLPAGLYKATFNLDKTDDTFLNFESWGKGLVYVNGYPLGRIWEIGPQQTLYTPGAWLREGENEIMVFDIIGPKDARTQGLDAPVLDKVMTPDSGVKRAKRPELSGHTPIATGSFNQGNGWQKRSFDRPVKGRYLCFEALDAIDQTDYAAIAELYLLDKNGHRISREPWTSYYADSEDASGGNHTLPKVFDLQESTFWASKPDGKFPYLLVIDLGKEEEVSGIEYLPRMESGAPGAIRNYTIFLENNF